MFQIGVVCGVKRQPEASAFNDLGTKTIVIFFFYKFYMRTAFNIPTEVGRHLVRP